MAVKVLVIDDEPHVLDFISRLLSIRGYEVATFDCPVRALEFVQSAPRFDLVISDVVMPGLSGPDLVKEMQGRWPDIPVVFISGYLSRAQVPAHAEFLSKPFPIGELFAAIDRALATPSGGEAGRSLRAAGT